MQTKINSPKEMPITKDFLEQRPDYIKSRFEWSNGLILITEIDAEGTTVHSNYNWIQEIDGSLTPDYASPNSNFVDVK
ncbi:hypothetical protein [Paucilactobacillus kaifaensis]|uniref:hypothetical protein n=1 Tax=Paucilactobacillus kaifaensis TaxID=2559921 RepID=UPI0010FA19CC|nr:hypothetical protein [Paucilactobacillus kaifaensis]